MKWRQQLWPIEQRLISAFTIVNNWQFCYALCIIVLVFFLLSAKLNLIVSLLVSTYHVIFSYHDGHDSENLDSHVSVLRQDNVCHHFEPAVTPGVCASWCRSHRLNCSHSTGPSRWPDSRVLERNVKNKHTNISLKSILKFLSCKLNQVYV